MASSVERVELPGVGFRSVFATSAGVDVGVLDHNSGRKEVLVYSQEDPDQCASVVTLNPAEAQAMADLLGVTVAGVGDTLLLGSLVVKAAVVDERSPLVGRSLTNSETSAATVGIIRNDQLLPTSEALLHPSDVVLLAGSADAVSAAVELIEHKL